MQNPFSIIFKLLVYVGISVILTIAIFLGYGWLTQYDPLPIETLKNKVQGINIKKKELSIMTWNIGYFGLGEEMDFFYDGGKMVKPDAVNFTKYKTGITSFIKSLDTLDFMLIQEMDNNSSRSFYLNEEEYISSLIPEYNHYYAINYNSYFVPLPLKTPMGKVLSGICTYSKHPGIEAKRYAFPNNNAFPDKLFLLNRCFLLMRYNTSIKGKQLVLLNIHNSAYENDEQKKHELDCLKETVMQEYRNGNFVIVGGDWNQCPPGFNAKSFANNQKNDWYSNLKNVDESLFGAGWTFAYDSISPTNRSVEKPYLKNETYTTIIDFFALSPNIELVEVSNSNLEFKFSDHNPVLMKIRLKE